MSQLPTTNLIKSLLNSSSFKAHAAEYVAAKRPCFAILKIGGEVVDEELDTLSQTCAFLNDVGLLPAIVHGGGPQMNKELEKRGVEPQYVRGSRVTDEKTLEVAVSVFTELNQRVVAALQDAGAPARAIPGGVFQSQIASKELGFVGEVSGVQVDKVQSALQAKQIPVLTSLGFSADHPNLNINADVAARELALAIKPNRVVYTSAKGGWIDDDTKMVVPKIVMEKDYERLASLNYEGRQGTLLKLNEIKALLDGLPEDAAVTIASAGGILTQLFSPVEYQSGTTFTKSAVTDNLVKFDSIGAVDLGRLATLFAKDHFNTETLAQYQNAQAEVIADSVNFKSAAIVAQTKSGKKRLEAMSEVTDESALPERLAGEYAGSGLAWSTKDIRHDPLLPFADGTAKVGKKTVAWFGKDYDMAQAVEAMGEELSATTPPASKWNAPLVGDAPKGKKDIKVGLIGARGYVGRELVKLIAQHSRLDLALASSRALIGKSVAGEFNIPNMDPNLLFVNVDAPNVHEHPLAKEIDVWVLALPNGLAPAWVEPLEALSKGANNGTGAVLIDLGADFRFDDTWTYGLPERHGARDTLKGTRRISNPGCYATGAQVGVMPLVHNSLVADVPTVFGLSGYSGAGTNPSEKNDPLFLRDNIIPYALVNHIHEREVSRHCNQRIAFMPHVAPYFQGIALTVSAHLNKDFSNPKDEFYEMYSSFYQGEPLVKVVQGSEPPRVRDNMTQHHTAVGGFTWDEKHRRLAMHVTIDNLLKGAATQAIQNINLALGVENELDGLNMK